MMRFAWVGLHAEGVPALEALVAAGAPIEGVLTLTSELAAKRALRADYRPVCERLRLPVFEIPGINEPAALEYLSRLAPDVVFVIGWHQLVRAPALRLARVGMIGAHASLLPHNRGSAPVNWAMIRGERQGGNTLFWLGEEVDGGDLIDQTAFPITLYDTCATIYQRIAATNRSMLLRLWPRLVAGERPGRPMPRATEPPLPRRRPSDGWIDWSGPAEQVYDFIRALTRPYPGAFSTLDGQRWTIWTAARVAGIPSGAPPGTVLGPVPSPFPEACGQLVACGAGAIVVLALEAEDGSELRGPPLSEQPWTGKRWGVVSEPISAVATEGRAPW